MAKRLYMTNADYLAIAISPALIMALVGSLVFFLIEVLYVGQYEARLDYAFALFVFAAVLIARISIEMGSERAALFALPLGIVMFLFLMRFVEHPSAFSHVINLVLLVVVWWCAHKLTWDSTVIDDDEDASGQGLMQRIGVDGPESEGPAGRKSVSVASEKADNELLEGADADRSAAKPWWSRFVGARSGPHSPGLWVLYFSLAALPLFGIGQHWIPAADVGRRRYVFFLLLVYVASALALLVSTSFLNLRRYLRQRRVEMPAPIAGTWVGVGTALIAVVMLLATLIPRPNAEIALSRPPWQAGSPDGLSASRTSVLRDGGEKQNNQAGVAGEATDEHGMKSDQPQDGQKSAANSEADDAKSGSGTKQGEDASGSREQSNGDGDKSSSGTQQDGKESSGESGDRSGSQETRKASEQASNDEQSSQGNSPGQSGRQDERREPANGMRPPLMQSHPMEAIQSVSTAVGGLAGVLKILLYVAMAILFAFLIWKYRHEIMQALADIWRQLFSGSRAEDAAGQNEAQAAGPPPRKFTDFRDPFQSGQHGQYPPEELVRYTFAAFEAWSNDRGRPRTPDCTPQELLGVAVEPATPIYAEARRLVRLYCEVAYASRQVPREAAGELAELWRMMRTMYANEAAMPPTP